jgi:hypothetical protein
MHIHKELILPARRMLWIEPKMNTLTGGPGDVAHTRYTLHDIYTGNFPNCQYFQLDFKEYICR